MRSPEPVRVDRLTSPFAAGSEASDLLQDVLDEQDPLAFALALRVAAKRSGHVQLLLDAGLTRDNLHRWLAGEGSPSFGDILRMLKGLGLGLRVVPLH